MTREGTSRGDRDVERNKIWQSTVAVYKLRLLRGRDLGFVHWILASLCIAKTAVATGFPTAPNMFMSRHVFLAMIVTTRDIMDCVQNIHRRYAAHVERQRSKFMVTQNAGAEPPALHIQDRIQIMNRYA